jgi:hypothetical protein
MCDCTSETWAPIPGYEGSYEVGTCGRVRSLDRTVPSLNRWGTVSDLRLQGRVLSPGTDQTGYQRVVLLKAGKGKSCRIHDLVLRAFIGPPPPRSECCHWDGDRSNNHLSNLRWDTRSANIYDNVRNGTHHQARKVCCKRNHLLVMPNLRADIARKGYRGCQACYLAHKERDRYAKNGQPFDLQAAADAHYARIMSAVPKPQ